MTPEPTLNTFNMGAASLGGICETFADSATFRSSPVTCRILPPRPLPKSSRAESLTPLHTFLGVGPWHPFLNGFFIWIEGGFPAFGALFVALFSGYLYLCVCSGLFKMGIRVLCISFHPMRYGKTLINRRVTYQRW